MAGAWIALRINPICVPIPLVYNMDINSCCSDLKHVFLEKFILVLSSVTSRFVSFCGFAWGFLKAHSSAVYPYFLFENPQKSPILPWLMQAQVMQE